MKKLTKNNKKSYAEDLEIERIRTMSLKMYSKEGGKSMCVCECMSIKSRKDRGRDEKNEVEGTLRSKTK
jgi:hypothetical protein